MRALATTLALASVALGIAIAAPRRADAADTQAQTLFEEGKRLMARGDTSVACERFAESQRLEPAGGTLLHLANCRELEGKTATAWTLFHEALSVARAAHRADREHVALEHLAALEPRLARVRVVVPAAARAYGPRTLLDGREVDPALWGVATPIDPGAHEVVARAPGRAAWGRRLASAASGAIVDVEIPALAVAPPEPIVAARALPEASPSATSGGIGAQRGVAIGSAALGVLGVGLGTYFGARSMAKHDETDRLCGGPAPSTCPAEGLRAADDARTFGNLSTGAFVVGLIALAGGVAIWLTAPSRGGAVLAPKSSGVALTF